MPDGISAMLISLNLGGREPDADTRCLLGLDGFLLKAAAIAACDSGTTASC